MDAAVVGDVVAVISQRRGKEWQEPQAGDPELLEVIELLDQPREVTDAVAVGIEESLHVRFVDNRVLVPEGIAVDGADHSGTVPVPPGPREHTSPSSYDPARTSTPSRGRAASLRIGETKAEALM